MTALAWGCDPYFLDRSVGDAALVAGAGTVGLDLLPVAGSLGTSLWEWAEFWRTLSQSRARLRPVTLSNLLTAAGTTVSSPRGQARALHDPRRTIRATVGETETGAWVAGITSVAVGKRWTFALFLREGSARHATARCAHLLQETLRTFRQSTRERGGEPWLDLRE